MTTVADHVPETFEGVAEILAEHSAAGRAVRVVGAGTKPWTVASAGTVLRTTALDRILAHDPGDMTASLQAGVPLAVAQRAFADSGQMLALDPPLGADDTATIGGIVATGDCGPLAHRYGGPRDLVVGATFALSDGTIARSGGTVIKNVAGYDVAKLLCGSFGTLGVILSVNVRLHPVAAAATVTGAAADATTLANAAHELAALPAELEALDASWSAGGGALHARLAGPTAVERAQRVGEAMRGAGLGDVATAHGAAQDELWAVQRARQRSDAAAVVHVAHAPSRLAAVLDAAEATGAGLVARPALGRALVTVAPERIAELRARLPDGAVGVLRDCPAAERPAVDHPWGDTPAPALALMRAVKQRFDPAGICNPGIFVGGI